MNTLITDAQPVAAEFDFDLNADMFMAVIRDVKHGSVFTASGAENPTTGYTWNPIVDAEG